VELPEFTTAFVCANAALPHDKATSEMTDQYNFRLQFFRAINSFINFKKVKFSKHRRESFKDSHFAKHHDGARKDSA
jgi:hypothetical protein